MEGVFEALIETRLIELRQASFMQKGFHEQSIFTIVEGVGRADRALKDDGAH
jgi:hypothetical protein